jgi:mono/diheme cytochrome c family protein
MHPNSVAAYIIDIGTVRTLATCSAQVDAAIRRRKNKGSNMRLSAYRVALVMLACTNEVALAANPDNGSTLAQRWCTGCHVVSGGQIKGTDIAPSFASIAERPDYNVEKLASFLLEPHPKMPNMALSPEEAKDISALIAEQRRK